METVRPLDGDAVTLRPCPPWCTLREHFAPDDLVHADDGFHHYGPEIAIPTLYRMFANDPELVVKVILRAWTSRLDGEPDPACIELQLATTETNTDMYVELTPDTARAVSSALLKIASIAEQPETPPGGDRPA